jgi:hypothetical protein
MSKNFSVRTVNSEGDSAVIWINEAGYLVQECEK